MSMKASQNDIARILAARGIIRRRDHPHLARALDGHVRSGSLTAVLPGVYSHPNRSGTFETRVQALMYAYPDAVLVEHAAAKVSFWPGIRSTEVACALRTGVVPRRGFTFQQRQIPAALIVEQDGIRFTAPALTALDLVEFVGGDAIDNALRQRATTLPRLRAAMEATKSRRGNAARWTMLLDSRDEPWSNGERRFHRMLRIARITGWQPNFPLKVAGSLYWLDVAFPELRLCIEVDGQVHRYDEATFEGDRWRQNALVLDGWRVIRFTMRMIEDHPDVVLSTIRAAMEG